MISDSSRGRCRGEEDSAEGVARERIISDISGYFQGGLVWISGSVLREAYDLDEASRRRVGLTIWVYL